VTPEQYDFWLFTFAAIIFAAIIITPMWRRM